MSNTTIHMEESMNLKTWGLAALISMTAALAACGGGGGGGPAPDAAATPPVVTPPVLTPDSRDGIYSAYTQNGKRYTMTLAVSAGTLSSTNGTATETMHIEPVAGQPDRFAVVPWGGVGVLANQSFYVMNDAIFGVGSHADGRTEMFFASRNFAQSVAEATGTYNQFGTDKAPAEARNNLINTFEITPTGSFNLCSHTIIFAVANCDPAGRFGYSLTVANGEFTAAAGTSTFSFRVAKFGTERIVIRADTGSSSGIERFRIALPETAGSYANGVFDAADSMLSGGLTFEVADPNYTATGTLVGSGYTTNGTLNPIAGLGLRGITAGANGNYFTLRGAKLGVVIAARNNAVVPGYMALGVAR